MRRPQFVAPHQPRLDWQMWFAALDPLGAQQWLGSFLFRLLEGTPEVVALLEENPFPDAPPPVRTPRLLPVSLSSPAQKSEAGAWWQREFVEYLTEPLSLGDLAVAR